jgi:hypothetical protein
MDIRLVMARPFEAAWARKFCDGISARYAYPIAEAPVVEKVAIHAKKIYIDGLYQCFLSVSMSNRSHLPKAPQERAWRN